MQRRIKQFAIIAAGEGRRLSEEGVAQPKALVSLCGEPLLTRLVRIFQACDAERIVPLSEDEYQALLDMLPGSPGPGA